MELCGTEEAAIKLQSKNNLTVQKNITTLSMFNKRKRLKEEEDTTDYNMATISQKGQCRRR